MENTIFRSALGGFNRQDVMAYIEKAQKEAAETAQRLEEENETLRREGEELRQSLEALTQERDQLSGQTAELTEQCAGLRSALEAETAAREAAQKDAEDRAGAVRSLEEENRQLGEALAAREAEAATLRREKERVAQLELDAQQRAADVLAQAQTQAEGLLDQARREAESLRSEASAQGERLVSQAREQAQAIYQQMAGQVTKTAGECREICDAFDSVAAHVASELRRMDVAVSQLPISLNRLREGLDALSGQQNPGDEA